MTYLCKQTQNTLTYMEINTLTLPNQTTNTTIDWQEWQPATFFESTLEEVHKTLPGLEASDINWLVRLLENPVSKLALPGSIPLFEHDCMHIVLSRGLLNQDEAFVIGVTMGNASKYTNFKGKIWKVAARYLYPVPYRVSDCDLYTFNLGVAFGKTMAKKDCHLYNFCENKHKTIAEVRQELGIDVKKLHAAFEKEIQYISPEESVVSKRLLSILSHN